MSKYGVISGPHFPVFGLNTGKYGPEITPYLDTFRAVAVSVAASKSIVLDVDFTSWKFQEVAVTGKVAKFAEVSCPISL